MNAYEQFVESSVKSLEELLADIKAAKFSSARRAKAGCRSRASGETR